MLSTKRWQSAATRSLAAEAVASSAPAARESSSIVVAARSTHSMTLC